MNEIKAKADIKNKMSGNPVLEAYANNLNASNKKEKEGDQMHYSVVDDTMIGKHISTGIIGIGQCGGNIASLGKNQGFLTCAVNTSKEDLNNANTDLKYLFTNAKGSGKERNRSKKIFAENIENFNKYFADKFKNIMNIIIISSAGGGTGGGSAPMCARFLKDNYPEKNIFLITIIGSIMEDIKSQENMLNVLEEINKCDVNYLVFDNNKTNSYEKVNNEVISACEFITRQYFIDNSRSNIDPVDMQKLYLENKRMVIVSGYFNKNISNTTSYTDQIIDAIRKSTQIEPSGTPMSYGIFMSTSDDVYENIDLEFRDLVTEFGEPYEVYKHLQPSHKDAPEFVICMSGLSDCVDRYEKINKRITEFNQRQNDQRTIADVEKATINARESSNVVLPDEVSGNKGIDKSSLDMFM